MSEIVVTTENEADDEAARAALAAAALAGAALNEAGGASDDAASAQATADAALEEAARANSHEQGISPEEARTIAREENERYMAELAEWNAAVAEQEAVQNPPAGDGSDGVPDEVLPPSVKKAGGEHGEKPRFMDRWYGKKS